MIAILAGKASAGRDIARIVGADKKHDGYMSGNGYFVTWASGHLLALASPEDYGITHISTDDMPFIPEKFILIPRRNKLNKQPDSNAVRQLRIIKNVIKRCRSIIVATEPDEDGELLFRNIYHYFRCRKPVKRLWINSLTDDDIQEGLARLEDSKAFDNLYQAAYARARADWMIATNASRALCITSGIGNDSLGRLHTPVLAMVCKRYLEHIHFVAKPYWQLKLQVEKEGTPLFFTCNEQFKNKATAEKIYNRLKGITDATVCRVEQKEIEEEPPLLYNLTELQKDANIRFGFTADETQEISQLLYEKKLIPFPKTAGRYILNKQFKTVPGLLDTLLSNSFFAAYAIRLKQMKLNSYCVNNRKVNSHPAILITGKKDISMDENEEKIYNLIVGRMLEAFSPCCIKESVDVEINCNGFVFSISGVEVKNKGWKEIYHWNDDKNTVDGNNNNPVILNEFKDGESIKINSHNLIQFTTKAKPLLTEASLLDAMDDVLDVAHKHNRHKPTKAMDLCTPTVRSSVIETLIEKEYIERDGIHLVPTKKGQFIYEAVKNMRIADAELAAGWEQAIRKIEKDSEFLPTFLEAFKIHTRQVTDEIISLRMAREQENACICPKCKRGQVNIYFKLAKCSNSACNLTVYRNLSGKNLTDNQLQQLLRMGKTSLIKGFKDQDGNTFEGTLSFDKDFTIVFSLPRSKAEDND